jgi:hypothetical protein
MKYFCNPLNVEYKYQFNKRREGDGISVSREAADPSMILFKGRYYIFPSMTCGFFYSDDLAEWKFYPLKNTPAYDYAPDVCVAGNYVYFCASNWEHGRFYRTKDPFSDEFERLESVFPFWDPKLFADDDGRLYFYWGSGAATPIYGIELSVKDLQPIGERRELILCDENLKGFERRGEDHSQKKTDPATLEATLKAMETQNMSEESKQAAKGYLLGLPYNEGAWMTKHNDKYYLQYATPGAQFNIYCDAVYVSDTPLGDFVIAKNNPFSYKPGGFLPGAGHGSTMEDANGNYWHISTMRIGVNHVFERRIGLWRAGFDESGEMFCDQRYGDFPFRLDQKPWEKPDFMLLSYGKMAKASSFVEGKTPGKAFDENVRTWWRAAINKSGEWLEVDLGEEYDVRAIQINFADDGLSLPLPEGAVLTGALYQERWIDETHQPTRWRLEGSVDAKGYFIIEDKNAASTDLPHDLVVREEGFTARYIKLIVLSLPYSQTVCVSGLRVFGKVCPGRPGHGEAPPAADNIEAVRESDIDIGVTWDGSAMGYNVLWGFTADKLYHSYQVFDKKIHIGGLVKGQPVYLRVDSFNESGITESETIKL